MFSISFLVTVPTELNQKVKIVGSLPILGNWNPEKALSLIYEEDSWASQEQIFIQNGLKFEFKIIKIKANQEIEWEIFLNNSNRKFKAKYNSKLVLTWFKQEGKVIKQDKTKRTLNGLPGVIMNGRKFLKKKSSNFDPYSIAGAVDSEEENESEFILSKKKMGVQEIAITKKDFEQIYNASTPVEMYCNLLKKTKVYLLSEEINIFLPFFHDIEEDISEMAASYYVKWIALADFNEKIIKSNQKLKRRSSLYQLNSESTKLNDIITKNCYFIFLNVDIALKFQKLLPDGLSCLYLKSDDYEYLIENLELLTEIKFICFDSVEKNKQLFQFLQSKFKEKEQLYLNVEKPSILFAIEELQSYKFKDSELLNMNNTIDKTTAVQAICENNSTIIIDAALVKINPLFFGAILDHMKENSILILIQNNNLTKELNQCKQYKNVIIIYDHFDKVIVEGLIYEPLRKFKETFQLIKIKSKFYKEMYKGEIIERQNAIIYELPAEQSEVAKKLEVECKAMLKQMDYFKIYRKDCRIKITWNLCKQIRTIRTIMRIKYINFGQLGDYHLVAAENNFSHLEEEIKLLIQHRSAFYEKLGEAKINSYSFGSKISANITIVDI